MKILIVNYSDINGGAARAAYRLHKSLQENSVDSLMLVASKESIDNSIIGPNRELKRLIGAFRPFLDSLPLLRYKKRNTTLFSLNWLRSRTLIKKINSIDADIVHLHWISNGMLSIKDIKRINAPIVWSMHDNWLFTGGCHVKWNCDKYLSGCGNCPQLGSKNKNDLSKRMFSLKTREFSKKSNFVVIGLSNWISSLALNSGIFDKDKIVTLPNPINIKIFRPFDKTLSRELLNLPKEKKLLAFGGMNPLGDKNKGFQELSQAIKYLDPKNVEFVIFGDSNGKFDSDFTTHYVGSLKDDMSLRILFSAVDATLVPSLQENLSNVIMESLSCGTPVVAFDVGGNSDLIDHKVNGYLAKPSNIHDFANGINWLIHLESIDLIKSNCRKKVEQIFESNLVAKKYIKLYESLI